MEEQLRLAQEQNARLQLQAEDFQRVARAHQILAEKQATRIGVLRQALAQAVLMLEAEGLTRSAAAARAALLGTPEAP